MKYLGIIVNLNDFLLWHIKMKFKIEIDSIFVYILYSMVQPVISELNKINLIDAYACEGTSLIIGCNPREKIKIHRANYGRLNAAICNEHRKTEGLNIKCANIKSAHMVFDMCDGSLNPCILPANNKYFGDTCSSTPKYLEVQYSCENASLANSRSTLATPIIEKLVPTTTIRDIRYGENFDDGLIPDVYPNYDGLTPWDREKTTTRRVQESNFGLAVEKEDYVPDPSANKSSVLSGCPSVLAGQIIWPFTNSQVISMPCPHNSKEAASWTCDLLSNQWVGEPDFTMCDKFKQYITNEINELNSNFSLSTLKNVLNMLNKHTKDYDNISASDMYTLLDAVSLIVESETEVMGQVPLRILNQEICNILDGLANDMLLNSLMNDASLDRRNIFSKYISVIEDTMFQLARSMLQPSVFHYQKNNILFELHVINASAVHEDIAFPKSDTINEAMHQMAANNHIVFRKENILEFRNQDSLTRLVFALHRNLHKLIDDSHYQIVNLTRGDMKNYSLNSVIMSASVSEPSTDHHLRHNVTITFQHIIPNIKNDILCGYWNVSVFMTTGCTLVSTNRSHSVCSCNHLTSFSILMSINDDNSDLIGGTNGFMLSLLTYLGCIISIISLMLSFLVFHFLRNLQCDRNTIHKNLTLCLCIAQIIFLTGIIPFGNKVICSVVAALLHYFFLCAFMWMFFEGVHIYSMIIEVFESSSRIILFYILAYSIPAVIVIVSAIVNLDGYGTAHYCWLSNEKGFIWAFIGPVLLIITINSLILSMTLYVMCKQPQAAASNSKLREKSHFYKLKWWMRGLVTIIVLLGLTWIFGLLYINRGTLIFAYMFTIFNANQGLFIFVFYCLLNENVRKEVKRIFSNFPKNSHRKYKTTASLSPRSSSSNPLNYLNRLLWRKSRAQSTSLEQKPSYEPAQLNKGSDQGTDSGIMIHSSNSHIYSEPTLDDASAYLDPLQIKLDVEEEVFYEEDLTQMEGSIANTDYFDKYCRRHNSQLDIDKYILKKSMKSNTLPTT